MDLQKIVIYFLTILFTCTDVWCISLHKILHPGKSRSKRTPPAEMSLDQSMQRERVNQQRRLYLSHILSSVHTGDIPPSPVAVTTAPIDLKLTQVALKTTRSRNGRRRTTRPRPGHKKKKGKGKKTKGAKTKKEKGRKRKGKKPNKKKGKRGRKSRKRHHGHKRRNPRDAESLEAERWGEDFQPFTDDPEYWETFVYE